MEKEFFRQIYLYVDSQYIRVVTQYWVYECGACESVPAFLLPRDCSDEDLLDHIKICLENSRDISEKEYEKLGGWDAVKKVLKIKSEKNFCQTSVGFSLEWSGEMAVHISVWKYYVGKAASQTTADETFDLEYDEASPAKFVVRLRQIMEEMYEKYHVKSNDEIRQAKKKPGIREINKALSELDKKDTLFRKSVSKKYKWKQSSYINWKVEGGYYFYLEHLNCYGEATLYVKPLYIDDLWWDVFEMSSNKKEPMSLRGNGAFALDGVRIMETPDLFDIRAEESEYELEKIQKYSDEDIEKIWDNVFQQFDNEVQRFLKENPDPDSYFPEEEKCYEYYTLITYLHAGDRQKVLDKIAELRATPDRMKTRFAWSYDDGTSRDGLDFIEAWCLRELAEQGDVTAQYKLGTAYEEGSCVHIDNEKAVFWYRKAAEQGNSSAQYSLGRMFDYGCGVPEDKQEAAIWYRKAAEQGDGNAQNDLGVMYLTGEGVPEDKSEAIFWLQKAAEQGVALAQNNLGIRYLNGDGVPQEMSQAAIWFRKAAEQGLAAAQFRLGKMYDDGIIVPENKTEAANWYRKAAKQGDREAQNNLGVMYLNGEGVNQDKSEAVFWFRKAAEQGVAEAQNELGVLFLYGEGVNQDKSEAVFWFRKAAEQGVAEAQNELGVLFLYGEGVNQDKVQAISWFSKAAELGLKEAQYNLGVRYLFGEGVSEDKSEAFTLFQKAAAQGFASAQFRLGKMYDDGIVVSENKTEAANWYRKAAKQGDKEAQNNLGVLFLNGEGVPQDKSEAEFWFRKAAEQGVEAAQNNLDLILQDNQDAQAKGIKHFIKRLKDIIN